MSGGPGATRAAPSTAADPLEVSPVQPATWRLFGTSSYFRLWMAQVVSSTGDWIGLVAILAIAARVSDRPEAAISLVMVARMVPGFFLAPVGGVIADRFDRRHLMAVCDLGRAAVVAALPFVTSLSLLFLASFVLEVFTLLWTPAKDASVPNLVPDDKLMAANSLGLAAAFGTFPVGAGLFASLAAVAEWLNRNGAFEFVRFSQESLALWLDALTFGTSALLIFTLHLPGRGRRDDGGGIDWTRAWRDLVEGVHFITSHRLVRAVMLGLGTGLLGGAAVIPLGPVFTEKVLGSTSAGFGLLMFAMGIGVAVGVVGLSAFQRLFPREAVFAGAVVGSGVMIVAAASTGTLSWAVPVVGIMGLSAGAGYVAGFTLLHENVADELRGRTFGALYTVIRLCVVLALTVWPLLAGLLDSVAGRLMDDRIAAVLGRRVVVPGVRLALWLGGVVVIIGGALAALDVHRARRDERQAVSVAEPAP